MGVSLHTVRCAHVCKVGVLRANGAAPRPPTPWARVKAWARGFAPCYRTPFACLTQQQVY
ncbi:MAG: hypothetical protein RML94_06625 [Bacteroidia bacterium]|nr:hypothetical protein [Bacteroidia bacterium]